MAVVTKPSTEISTPSWYFYKNRTVQSQPYVVATQYSLWDIRRITATGTQSNVSVTTDLYLKDTDPMAKAWTFAYNKAFDRFTSELSENSSFGATLTAERRETFGMISGFVVRLLRSGMCAKRGDILGVLHNLGFNPPLKQVTRTYSRKTKKGKRKFYRFREEYYRMPDGRMVLKASANTWLLWSYGVSPLLSDIQNATDVFIRSTPLGRNVRAYAKEPVKVYSNTTGGGSRVIYTVDGAVRVGLYAKVTVSNYDLWLANQLGFVNPIQFINEAIPFSFVVDWFSNLSSVINSLTYKYGLAFSAECNSRRYHVTMGYTYSTLPPYVTSERIDGVRKVDYSVFQRFLGVHRPTLEFRYERFEWRRALNAISLLVGFLPKTQK